MKYVSTRGEDNKLKFEGDNAMWISEIRNVTSHTERTTYTIDLVSKEFLANELCGTEVYARYDGEISESVEGILKESLQTEKSYEADVTKNNMTRKSAIFLKKFIC